jgi:hypothetical protein
MTANRPDLIGEPILGRQILEVPVPESVIEEVKTWVAQSEAPNRKV